MHKRSIELNSHGSIVMLMRSFVISSTPYTLLNTVLWWNLSGSYLYEPLRGSTGYLAEYLLCELNQGEYAEDNKSASENAEDHGNNG